MPASNDRAARRDQVRDSYATVEALAFYRKRVDQGLRIWEATVVYQHFPARGRVLTLGCGAGRETFALEQLGYDTTGVDMSQPLLEMAHEIGQQRGHLASFCLIDGETLPFDDGAFDVVTLWAQMLGDVPSVVDRIALMQEVRRVLAPAGLATWSVHDDERTRGEIATADIVSADVPARGDLVMHEQRENATRYRHLFSRDELVELARSAGFTDAQILHTSDLGEVWGNVFVVICKR